MAPTSSAPPAPALKDGFHAGTADAIAAQVVAVHPAFDRSAFDTHVHDGFDALSLMARVRRVADGLVAALPADFTQALPIVEAALGEPPQALVEGEGIAAFRTAPFLEWVAIAGLATPAHALPALARLTRHFTAEFAIRPFLETHPDLTFAHVARWVDDPDARVRRLASEGTRPLLPWGRHVAALKSDPTRALVLIAPLAADPSDIVRRSAANHLNDVSRLSVELALAHASDWDRRHGEVARGTVRHAVRNLVKQGHPDALRLLGFDVHGSVALRGLTLSARAVPIGGELVLDGVLHADAPVTACVDFAVRYASARGAERLKVFKGSTVAITPGSPCPIRFRRDFVPRTTRVLYPGAHAMQVRVNGVVLGEVDFELTA